MNDIDFSDFNNSLLIEATVDGNYELVRSLLYRGADPNDTLKSSMPAILSSEYMTLSPGLTALMIASLLGYINIVKLLIEYGANINLTDRSGDTALSLALEGKNAAIEQLKYNNTNDTRDQIRYNTIINILKAAGAR